MRSFILPLLVAAGASAFAPAQNTHQRTSVALNAEEMSRSIPFLVKPDKLDGTMAGDMGFDPMRLYVLLLLLLLRCQETNKLLDIIDCSSLLYYL